MNPNWLNEKTEPNVREKDLIKNVEDFFVGNKIDYFNTGSRHFGVSDHNSDYDIVVLWKENSVLKTKDFLYRLANPNQKIISLNNVEEFFKNSNYNDGFYAEFNDTIKINIIPLPTEAFENWKITTSAIKSMCDSDSKLKRKIKCKCNRIALFEILKGYFRLV